jgi:soluble lytic murein transglycosylase-like protein
VTKTYAVPRAETVRATRYVAADRGWQFESLISEHARLNGVRSDLVRAVVQVESAFNPNAISPKGAMGLMQLMPSTMRQYGVLNAFNPAENVRAGVAYLRDLLDRYSNNEELALAAYNAGPGAVDKHGQAVPPYRETRNYVAKINKMTGTTGRVEPRPSKIYKVTQVIDGREVILYTDKKPATPPSP